MLAVGCILIPSFFILFLVEKLILKHKKMYRKAIKYILTVFTHNFVVIFIVRCLFGSSGNTIMKLTQYSNFALKYLLLSSVIALMEIFAGLFVKRKWAGRFRGGNEIMESAPLRKELEIFWSEMKTSSQNWYKEQKDWIQTNIRKLGRKDFRIVKSVFMIGFLAHIFVLTNHLVNYDSVWSIYGSENVIGSGRWFLKYAAGIGSYFRIPWLNGFLSILYISLSAAVTARHLDIKNVWLSILAGATMAVYPSVTLTFNFMYTADAYFLAMLMAVLAAWLICMDKWLLRILGGILCGLSMGIYQAYLSVTLILVLLWLIKQALMVRENVTWHVIGIAVSLIFAAVFYVTMLIYRLAGGQLDSYQGIAESTLLHSPKWYASRLIGCFQDTVQIFIADAFENKYVGFAIAVIWAITLLLLLGHMAGAIKKKQFASVIYGCLGIVSMPIAVYCLKLLSNGIWYYRLMLESVAFVWLLPIMVLDERLKEKSGQNRWNRAISLLMAACLLCNLWNYVIVDNISYFASALANKKTFALAERILDRMEQTEGYDESQYVWFCGNVEKAEYEDIRFQRKSVISNGIIPNSGENMVGYIRNFLGVDHEILRDTELIERIRGTAEFRKMPMWPKPGCIQVIGDTMVVKLGEEN